LEKKGENEVRMKRYCFVSIFLFVLAASATLAAQVLPSCVRPPSGIVAWWPGEGNADDLLKNSPGVMQNGVSFTTGKVGQAFQFDGVDDFILVANQQPFDFGAGPYSIVVWVQTLAGRGINEHIVSKGNLWAGGDDYVLFVGGSGDGRVFLQYSYWGFNDMASTTRADDGNWHLIVVTESGVCAGCSKLYIDGILEDTKDGVTLVPGVDPFIIGGTYSGGWLYPYQGAIDEVAVFHRDLTAAEVQSLFSAGSAGMCKSEYRFVGFFSPIENLPVINEANGGRTIPVKWRLVDSNGLPVTSLNSFTSLASASISCSADRADAFEEVNGTGLRYDADTSQFIYNWKTDKSWVGCRLLQLTLSDGTRSYAKFQFR